MSFVLSCWAQRKYECTQMIITHQNCIKFIHNWFASEQRWPNSTLVYEFNLFNGNFTRQEIGEFLFWANDQRCLRRMETVVLWLNFGLGRPKPTCDKSAGAFKVWLRKWQWANGGIASVENSQVDFWAEVGRGDGRWGKVSDKWGGN